MYAIGFDKDEGENVAPPVRLCLLFKVHTVNSQAATAISKTCYFSSSWTFTDRIILYSALTHGNISVLGLGAVEKKEVTKIIYGKVTEEKSNSMTTSILISRAQRINF